MSTRRAELASLRRVAVAALGHYPVAEGRLTFLTHGENTTFRHDGADGRYLVRVHRPQRHGRGVDSAAAVRSEIAWLQALRTDGGVVVPEPLLALDGAPTVTVARPGGPGSARCCAGWTDASTRTPPTPST